MLKLCFQLPTLGNTPIINRTCPICKFPKGQIHDHKTRFVQDFQQPMVYQTRIKCPRCNKTWTCYPKGITAYKHRSNRTIAYGIMIYFYGLGYRYSSASLSALGISVSHVQIYRDFIEICKKVQAIVECSRRDKPQKVRIMGVDGTYQKVKGQGSVSLIFNCDLDSGDLVEVQLADEEDPQVVKAWIKTWKMIYSVEAIMTDGHKNYEYLDDYTVLEVNHLTCKAHFVKAKVIRARKLIQECERRRYSKVVDILKILDEILHDLSPPKEKELQELFNKVLEYKKAYSIARRRKSRRPRHFTPGYRTYLLVTEVFDKFQDLVAQDVSTNNATERQIGLTLKIRSKLMRGFEVPENILLFARFAGYVRANGPRFNLAQVM